MRKCSKKLIALGLTVVMGASMLAGCGSSGSSGGSESDSTGAPAASSSQDGEKVLTFGCQMYSDGLVDPAHDINNAWNCMRFGIGEALYKFNDEMVAEPWLAESAESSDDFKTWTVTLKEGIKFSNGDDMTATKVKESFDRLREAGPDGSSTPEKFSAVNAEITADDAANTVTFVLPDPDYNFLGNLAYPVNEIVDVAAIDNWESGVIGTGPYAVENFTDQRQELIDFAD